MTKFLRFANETREGKNPELLVYGEIGEWWGDVQSRDFAEQLQAIDAPEIDVRINSSGGAVYTAQAIYSSLKRHPAKINVFVDGIAASAATIIMMAGDHIVMPENAIMMVHSPLTGAYGNAEELRDIADVLDIVRDTIVAVYRNKSGLDDDTILELLADDTYLSANEALELGLVDEVTPALQIAASRGKNGTFTVNGLTIDAERYSNLPKKWLASVESQVKTGAAGNKPKVKEQVKMTLDELKAQYPELYEAVLNEGKTAGVEQERDRIKAIDEMTMKGHEALAISAKFETGISPEAFAIDLIKAEKAAKESYLTNAQSDAAPVAVVQPTANVDDDSDVEGSETVNAIAEGINSRHNVRPLHTQRQAN